MKYVVLSFDDARSDTYEIALPIMQRYGLTGTVNTISNYVNHPNEVHFMTADRSMTPEQVVDWQKKGCEIGCHGSTHRNTVADILLNIEELKSINVDVSAIGFASPNSWLTDKNVESSGINTLIEKGILKYLRSGVQIRREGPVYTGLAIVEQITHNKFLYYLLNKKNVVHRGKKYKVLPSVAIKDYTTIKQIMYLISRIPEGDAVILLFHSILSKNDPLYGKDHYYWDADLFDNLCNWIENTEEIVVISTLDLLNI